ncbi:MAG: hypothetical protein JEZ11_04865 [Desulfobacterales bacterium]|nr:hypothetical protein [Desulfobacterales bacterium]
MKQYVIDELRPSDHETLKAYLDGHLESTGVSGLYHLRLPEDLLTDIQKAHDRCQPLYLALELGPDALACELLVRTDSCVRCDCMGYATPEQCKWAMETVDAVLDKLSLIH